MLREHLNQDLWHKKRFSFPQWVEIFFPFELEILEWIFSWLSLLSVVPPIVISVTSVAAHLNF